MSVRRPTSVIALFCGKGRMPAMRDPLPALVVDNLPAAHRSLRIAVVTETFPPEVNGVATSIARVIGGLRERNHDLQLIRPRQEQERDVESTPRFHELLMRGRPIPRYSHLQMGLPALNALRSNWSARRPDLVHIATEGPLGWSALQTARRLRLPVTSDFRTNFHAYSKHYGMGWLHKPIMAYLRKFHNHTHRTMVPTAELERSLGEYGFRRLAVVARGVDIALFSPHRRSEELRRSWGVGPDTLVVLHVGRLAPEKNLEMLLSAFDAIRSANHDTRLVLVGDGPARKSLQARRPDAIFAGTRSGEELATHYASADVFLFPSLTETFGNVTPEAMASGVPVLAYAYAAAAELIRSGENGILAPLDAPAEFATLARGLANARQKLRDMGLRAHQSAAGLSWHRITDQIESIFTSTIDLAGALGRA
jgi:glycosyltransferase involved in cell wall biosynthesis